MPKEVHSIRPRGRTPVISGRVYESLHARIAEAAKFNGRTMSEELAALADEALEHRNLVGGDEARRAVTWLTSTFVMAGEHAAREQGVDRERWTDDFTCRHA